MNNTNYNILRYLAIASFTILLFSRCTKNQNIVPYVYVDHNINISLPYYSSLNSIGGWAYISGGSQGIIVYRQSYDQFSAYDRHCTYNAENPCGKASVDSTNSFVECSCDSSKYQLYDGLVIQGPATYSLKNYQTSFDIVTNQIHIFN
jgi:nitrite reductase/ring-hydroxylating ferredoxin subunit|tara:strand:+ start:75 stop:518 length:444 start_codon:yes stop_codon:yes gene_type:complete